MKHWCPWQTQKLQSCLWSQFDVVFPHPASGQHYTHFPYSIHLTTLKLQQDVFVKHWCPRQTHKLQSCLWSQFDVVFPHPASGQHYTHFPYSIHLTTLKLEQDVFVKHTCPRQTQKLQSCLWSQFDVVFPHPASGQHYTHFPYSIHLTTLKLEQDVFVKHLCPRQTQKLQSCLWSQFDVVFPHPASGQHYTHFPYSIHLTTLKLEQDVFVKHLCPRQTQKLQSCLWSQFDVVTP